LNQALGGKKNMDEENAMHAMKNLFQKQSTSFDDYLNDEQQEQKEDNGFM
jgi:SWI/SNF-related matrix-associated actin-dependent regulator 1 of chromatin subfamily A